ncbi:MAG: hypothetical protein VX272_03930, partial [Planctomycetota bacterium]|nr:hypothetical protein [Planctomycetota bacterium]
MRPIFDRLSLLTFTFLLVAGLFSPAEAQEEPKDDLLELRKKQEAQERANVLARDLVLRILDIQMQQLEENGLSEEPFYKDIKEMRDNITKLVKTEMKGVVVLLRGALGKEVDARRADVEKARVMIRKIIKRLYVERQNLMLRLKAAELAAEIRRLISHQVKVRGVTGEIAGNVAARQEALALTTIQDQRDTKELYLRLKESLILVSKWGGELGAGATDGLRILKAAGTDGDFDDAGKRLDAFDYPGAVRSQTLVIKGLKLLLRKIEETQGLLGSDLEAALKLLRELIKKQNEVKDSTDKSNLEEDEAVRKLVEDQTEIRRDLGELVPVVNDLADSSTLLAAARASAYDATGNLFDGLKEDAKQKQEDVLVNLGNLEARLVAAIAQQDDKRSASQLAARVRDLEEVKKKLQDTRKQQAAVKKTAARDLPAASSLGEKAAKGLEGIGEGKDLPPVVDSRLREADSAVRDSVRALAEAAKSAAAELPEVTEEKLDDASLALERASAEVEAALADAKREQFAVEIAELSRAAEGLERAAASERIIAKQSKLAKEGEGLKASLAKELIDEQGDIEAFTVKTAEGLAVLAPEVSKKLEGLVPQFKSIQKNLTASSEAKGEESKKKAAAAYGSADEAARELAEAAAELRKQIGETAEELAAESLEQLEEVSDAREAVDESLAERPEAIGDELDSLKRAQGLVKQALADQDRAAGRPKAAALRELSVGIQEALADQGKADSQSEELASGRADTALDATATQQEVADEAEGLAQGLESGEVGK